MLAQRFEPETPAVFCYHPLRWKMVLAALVAMSAAMWFGLPALRVVRTAAGVDPQALSSLAIAIACLVFGLSALAAVIVDLPRLSATVDEIRLETFFGTRTARWSSLGIFTVTGPRHVSRGCTASARIIGPEVSANLRGRSRFVISDVFRVPLAALMQELDTARPYAMHSIRTWPMLEGDAAFGVQGFTRPWLTYAMIGGLVLVFLEEHLRAIAVQGRGAQLSLATLRDLGGLDRDDVLVNGEWYRVFLATLLHGSVAHIVGNCIALLMAGTILELLAGRCWMLAIFILGGFGGSIMSIAASPPETLSVGASGAIMALFAAIPMLSFRLPEGDARSRVQARTFRILIPLLLPAAAAPHTDYGAHLGGMMVGLAAGWVLLVTWPETSRLPRFQSAAQGIIALWTLLLMLGTESLLRDAGRLSLRLRPASAGQVAGRGGSQCGDQGLRLPGDDLGRVAWLVDRRADAEAGRTGGVPGRDVAGVDAADRQHGGALRQDGSQRA
jgi:membrane associated rhomboid family serine protease